MPRTLALLTISLLPLVPAAVARADDPLPIYTNALDGSWSNWSWDTTANFANTNPVHGGAGQSLAVTHTAAWAGLYLHANTSLDATAYSALRFSIHGGATGGQSITLYAYDTPSTSGPGAAVPIAANTWTDVEIPISALGVTVISGLVWQSKVGAAQPTYYLDDIQLIPGEPPPPGQGPALVVDAAAGRHAISPNIYGMNFADAGLAAELQLPVNRWGGNGTTRYNWQTDVSNHASDWFFESLLNNNPNPGQLPNGSSSDRFIDQNLSTGTDSIITVPLIGWTPKPPRIEACGFSVTKYGPQQQTDVWRPDCGNGYHTDGTPITGNDPTDTSVAIGPDFVTAWIAHLTGRYGHAGQGGVRFYDLDNEPMLWNSTHRDVHPAGVTYDELRDRTYAYAAAIKAADPAAATLGPVLWGWCAYFYSAHDNCTRGSDYTSHGNMHFVPWYLQQMQAYEQQHGVRILDYLDLHYYPQANGVALASAGSSATQALRLRSTRSLWDATYNDESWIGGVQDGPVVRLIPRMRAWVNANYPGTKLAMTEYNWGALDHLNGALAQADVLGIFGREGLDLATLWDPPDPDEPGAFAFRIFRNYDGLGRQFGQTAVQALSADQGKVAIYAAQRSSDANLTLVLINKTAGALTSELALTHFYPAGQASMYRYSAADLQHVVHEPELDLPTSTVSISLPAASITLLSIPPALAPADFDGDTDVDSADYAHFLGCFTGPGVGPLSPACTDADLDHDLDVDAIDFGRFQRCITGPGRAAHPNCAE